MRGSRGFSLLEVMIALVLVAFAMTALLVAFVGSGQLGVASRKQATAAMLARTFATQLSHALYTDARLANNNLANDADFADSGNYYARLQTIPASGANSPDSLLGTFTRTGVACAGTPAVCPAGEESYTVYVNVAPQTDPVVTTTQMGLMIAVIVRYPIGAQFARAVSLAYRYNPTAVGVGQLPL